MKMSLEEKLTPASTCLIIIDIQKDFAAPDGFRGQNNGDLSMVEPMIKQIHRLIDAASQNKVVTLYTQQIYDPNKLNELQKEQYKLDGKLALCNPATGGHEFYQIQPPPELVIEKQTFNPFFNPKLQKLLELNQIKTLVIVGMDTHYCVEATVRHGFDQGYKIVIPKDAVANNAKHTKFHQNTLQLVESTFGTLTDTENVIRIWNNN
jgi:nicotinamidase-related amidase